MARNWCDMLSSQALPNAWFPSASNPLITLSLSLALLLLLATTTVVRTTCVRTPCASHQCRHRIASALHLAHHVLEQVLRHTTTRHCRAQVRHILSHLPASWHRRLRVWLARIRLDLSSHPDSQTSALI